MQKKSNQGAYKSPQNKLKNIFTIEKSKDRNIKDTANQHK